MVFGTSRRNARTTEPGRRAAAPAPRKHYVRQRVTAAGVMVVVGGLFVSLALPAYAQSEEPVTAARKSADAGQTLDTKSDVKAATVTVGDYAVTSAVDLRKARAVSLREQNIAAYLSSGAAAMGDDYPWPGELTRGQGGGLSPLRYYYRECVDFVAWRLNRDAGHTSSYTWSWGALLAGNASQWRSVWANHGWGSGAQAQIGSVAYFPGGNHVAYVSGFTADGNVVIEEYNMGGDHSYHQRIIDPTAAYYLYAPPA